MSRHRRRVAALLLAGILAGCSSPGPAGPARPDAATTEPAGAITVLAAASLTEAFTQLGDDFEADHPGSRVSFSFGSSATLATQVTQGAPADVYAAASAATMRTVTDAGAATGTVDFASNTLQLAVPPGNPGKVTGLADLADPRLRIALCAEQVPCGAAAVTVLAAAGVRARPDTLESDVKAVLQKVVADEVDAALVYRTDVVAAGTTVEGIEFPEAAQAVNRYPIAVLRESRNPATARAFVDHVLAPEGQQVLTEAGFGRP
jgi:molybdate transport system substrate-binding protein